VIMVLTSGSDSHPVVVLFRLFMILGGNASGYWITEHNDLIKQHVFILRTSLGVKEEFSENVCPQTNTCNDV